MGGKAQHVDIKAQVYILCTYLQVPICKRLSAGQQSEATLIFNMWSNSYMPGVLYIIHIWADHWSRMFVQLEPPRLPGYRGSFSYVVRFHNPP